MTILMQPPTIRSFSGLSKGAAARSEKSHSSVELETPQRHTLFGQLYFNIYFHESECFYAWQYNREIRTV